MRVLTGLDYGILVGYLLVVFGLGLLLTRRAGRSVEDFFVGGRPFCASSRGSSSESSSTSRSAT